MKLTPGFALAGFMVSACAEPPQSEAQMVSLTPVNRTVSLALPADHGGRAMLEIIRVDNPDQHPAMISVHVPGETRPLHRFSLYPPDQPARIAVRVPRQARTVIVELEKHGSPGPRSITLRTSRLPD